MEEEEYKKKSIYGVKNNIIVFLALSKASKNLSN